MHQTYLRRQGFTLIELSIVLVIIGLIVGGIVIGQQMIAAAEARATLSQIERYNTAVNTFSAKFGYLPGDIPDPYASNFGFAARGSYAGEGDGNGVIEGLNASNPSGNLNVYGVKQGAGETAVFWRDLSAAAMIDGFFAGSASDTTFPGADVAASAVAAWLPAAKLGHGNYVYAWSGGWASNGPGTGDGKNYFSVSAVTSIGTGNPLSIGRVYSTANIPVQQVYNMDKKIDDGYPMSGHVLALYINGSLGTTAAWANGTTGAPYTSGVSPGPSTCYDNGGLGGTQQYSTEVSGGNNPNCAVSFEFQ